MDYFFSVIRSSAGFCSFQASCNTNFNGSVEVEYGLRFANNLFKIDSLVNSSWETINQIVLINNGYLAENGVDYLVFGKCLPLMVVQSKR